MIKSKRTKFDDGGSVSEPLVKSMKAMAEGPVTENSMSRRLTPGKDYKRGGVVKGKQK